MVDGNASMYLGSPRMAEEVIGEKVTLEEMGGARMHCEVSGCGDLLVADDKAAIEAARGYLSYFGQSWRDDPPRVEGRAPGVHGLTCEHRARTTRASAFDMYALIAGLVDEASFFEIKPDFAKELITGLARIDGRAVGIVANQPAAERRRAVRRLRRQGGTVHLAVRRVQHPAGVPVATCRGS